MPPSSSLRKLSILAGKRDSRRHYTTVFCARSHGNKFSYVRSFSILRSGDVTYFSGRKGKMMFPQESNF